jgi:hypothetical protein
MYVLLYNKQSAVPATVTSVLVFGQTVCTISVFTIAQKIHLAMRYLCYSTVLTTFQEPLHKQEVDKK